ncbi:MAG: mechanosensitive ion channel [Acidobacteriota bacterium]
MENADGLIENLMTMISTWGLRVVGAIALLIIGRMVAGWIRRGIRRIMERREVDPTLIPFVSSLVYYLVIAFVVIAVLGIFGIPTASFVAVLGAAGLAVGLALQGTLSNFAAGVMLLVFRPFKIGDLVEVGGELGVIEAIGIFTTIMNSLDNKKIIQPNAQIFSGTIVNYDGNETRRVDMVMGIDYGDDVGIAIETIQKIVTAHPLVLAEPEARVAVSNLGDSSVDLVVRPWCIPEDYWTVYFDLTRQMKEGLEAAGCSIPFPQRDVHLYQEQGATA